jgi:ribonucleoside-diphosphate reductase alpha chain
MKQTQLLMLQIRKSDGRFRELVSLLYSGQIPQWDVSRVRPAGATLKTFGGRASGSEPLVELFKFTSPKS